MLLKTAKKLRQIWRINTKLKYITAQVFSTWKKMNIFILFYFALLWCLKKDYSFGVQSFLIIWWLNLMMENITFLYYSLYIPLSGLEASHLHHSVQRDQKQLTPTTNRVKKSHTCKIDGALSPMFAIFTGIFWGYVKASLKVKFLLWGGHTV